MAILTDTERRRVEGAVAAAERRTSAELAVVVARASDRYAAFPLLWSALLAFLAGGAAALLRPGTSGGLVFATEAIVFILGGLLFYAKPLRFRLVPAAIRREHASRLARLQFAGLVQARTREEVGLLVFVSLAERHVEILVDRAIAGRIPETAWQAVIEDCVPQLRDGRLAEGLMATIDRVTLLLEREFPAVPLGSNEIPNEVTQL